MDNSKDFNFSNLLEQAKQAKKQKRALQLCVVALVVGILVHLGWYSFAAFLAVIFLGAQAEGY